ncbi:MAG TPA: hypothetical protein P5571_04375 [Candidatus Krumholzibacteria bacterium]|nr:hypothetical protein [Candidatus Krumholzibacteria bacterium]HRX50576.1 hypothetical protein [Candidatus Krumholzibacteria bacterium]
MNRFDDVLRATATRLALPQPARLRVLLELSADLDDLYDAYRARGCDDAEAKRRAVESLDLSPEALTGLGDVHHGALRRLLDRAAPESLVRWERTLLGVTGLLAAALAVAAADGRAVVRAAGPWAWPALALGALALLLFLGKAYQLQLKQDHHPRRLRRGLPLLQAVALALPCLGVLGGWYQAWRLSVDPATAARPLAAVLLDWGVAASALVTITWTLGLLAALAWFFLSGRVGRIERDEAAFLLER